MSNDAFFWAVSVLAAAVVALQLYYGRIPISWTAKGWRAVEKAKDEDRFWLFIAAEGLLVLILIGQALFA